MSPSGRCATSSCVSLRTTVRWLSPPSQGLGCARYARYAVRTARPRLVRVRTVRTVRGAPGRAALCLWHAQHSTQEAGTRSPYVQHGGPYCTTCPVALVVHTACVVLGHRTYCKSAPYVLYCTYMTGSTQASASSCARRGPRGTAPPAARRTPRQRSRLAPRPRASPIEGRCPPGRSP